MNVLISGIGIAGPALAYWLQRHGATPVLVERAPALRAGGYVIDFWGLGYDLVEKMGVLPEVLAAGYQMREVRVVGDDGHRLAGFEADVFRQATLGRYTTLPRAELSAAIFRAVRDRVECRFGETITALEQQGDGVSVRFARGAPQKFDLVVGADGLHSTVRGLAFGPERAFESFLGYAVGAFEVEGYTPRDEDVYVAYSAPGRMIARFALRGDRTLFLVVAAEPSAAGIDAADVPGRKAYLRARLSGLGWECPRVLDALERCRPEDLYLDRVSQIRMDRWTRGRVTLVGDAAYAPSFLAGQGSALAIIGAYVLAGELARALDPEAGCARYEEVLGAFMRRKQEGARGAAAAFAPRTRLGIFVRNQLMRLFAVPSLATALFGRSLLDRVELPRYPEPEPPAPRRPPEERPGVPQNV